MKFTVTFKTPDAVDYAIDRAQEDLDVEGYDEEVAYEMQEDLRYKLGLVTSKFVEYGECITIEFDSDLKTAKVV